MSSAEESKSETSTASAGAAPSKGNNLVLILSAVNILATLGMVAILFMSFQHEKKVPSVSDISAKSEAGGEGEKKEGEGKGKEGEEGKGKEARKKSFDFGKMVTLDQFTVNLSTPGSVNPKFARVNISLEVPTEDAEGEVTSKMPQIRNVIIDLFNSKRPADLATAEGRDYIKEEIRNALNSFLVTGKIKGVFFTSFAMSG